MINNVSEEVENNNAVPEHLEVLEYRILDLGLCAVNEIMKNADHSGIIAVVFSKFFQNFRRNILLHRRCVRDRPPPFFKKRHIVFQMVNTLMFPVTQGMYCNQCSFIIDLYCFSISFDSYHSVSILNRNGITVRPKSGSGKSIHSDVCAFGSFKAVYPFCACACFPNPIFTATLPLSKITLWGTPPRI